MRVYSIARTMFNGRSIKTADNLRRRGKKKETAAISLFPVYVEACDPENVVLSGDNEPTQMPRYK